MHELQCKPCKKGATPVTDDEITTMLVDIPEWEALEYDGVKRLRRRLKFSNFVKAIAFTHVVSEIAAAQQHHPAILTEWGQVTVSWWTHSIGGLHKNDFIMASRTDRLEHAES